MGNAVIFKPASFAPFSTTYLAEIYDEAGFPKGSVQRLRVPVRRWAPIRPRIGE